MGTPEPILLDKRAAAEMLSICTGTLDRLIKTGELKVCRLQRRVLFTRRELEKFVARKSKSQ